LPPSYLPLSQNSPKLRAQKAGILPEARPGEGRSGPGMAPETPEGRHEGDQRCRGVGASSEQSSTRDPTQDAVRPGVGLKADSSARFRCPEPCFAAPSQAPVGHIGGKRAAYDPHRRWNSILERPSRGPRPVELTTMLYWGGDSPAPPICLPGMNLQHPHREAERLRHVHSHLVWCHCPPVAMVHGRGVQSSHYT